MWLFFFINNHINVELDAILCVVDSLILKYTQGMGQPKIGFGFDRDISLFAYP